MEELNREQLKKSGFNDDILPTKPEEKDWTIGNYATVWMGSVHNIPNYIAVGALFTLGLSVGQVFAAIMTASIILSAVMVLNGHAGSKYGLPFAMLIRSSFGTKGAQ